MMHRQGTKIYGLLMMGAKMGPSRLASHALTPVVFMNLAMLRMPPMKTTSVHWPLALASGAVSRPAAKNATSAAMATKPASTPCSFWVIQRMMAMATMMMPCFSFLETAPSALYCSLRKVTSPASFSFGLQMIVQYR